MAETVSTVQAGALSDAATSTALHGASGAATAEAHRSEPPEIPSGLDLIATFPFAGKEYRFDLVARRPETGQFVAVPVRFTIRDAIHAYQNQFFALLLVAVTGAVLARRLTRLSLRRPGRFQSLVELFVEAFRDLVYGVLGEKTGRRYLPYLGSLFLFILLCNLMGLVPFLRSPTSVYQTTFALGLCTFFYVQYTAFKRNGVIRYLYHLAGEPKGDTFFIRVFMWVMGIVLLLPLHILEELIKPISLSVRLFGNILGEDVLVGAFAAMGLALVGLLGWHEPLVGFPLQLPFFFLAVLGSTVQALVFALLSLIYFLLVLPHEETAQESEEK